MGTVKKKNNTVVLGVESGDVSYEWTEQRGFLGEGHILNDTTV